ncbi:hypothetical protein BJ878DRAFT_564752 [Calycina marina]|uniref:Uncharacterized protein n=1 Tax=Calycina marina TaxID=1763456 RepID=A0A9P8CI97_9HELO|nr:hypothetical protein BJ878DRAFT_564752 [Calycina marina]
MSTQVPTKVIFKNRRIRELQYKTALLNRSSNPDPAFIAPKKEHLLSAVLDSPDMTDGEKKVEEHQGMKYRRQFADLPCRHIVTISRHIPGCPNGRDSLFRHVRWVAPDQNNEGKMCRECAIASDTFQDVQLTPAKVANKYFTRSSHLRTSNGLDNNTLEDLPRTPSENIREVGATMVNGSATTIQSVLNRVVSELKIYRIDKRLGQKARKRELEEEPVVIANCGSQECGSQEYGVGEIKANWEEDEMNEDWVELNP